MASPSQGTAKMRPEPLGYSQYHFTAAGVVLGQPVRGLEIMAAGGPEPQPLAVADDDVVIVVAVAELREGGGGEGPVPGLLHHLHRNAAQAGVQLAEIG